MASMIILTIRSDKPEAELAILKNGKILKELKWSADRRLAETIHIKLETLLKSANLKIENLDGIIAFCGQGSFTGLRIGLSVVNALASGFGIPIVSGEGTNWQKQGIKKLLTGQNSHSAIPNYGGPAYTSKPRK